MPHPLNNSFISYRVIEQPFVNVTLNKTEANYVVQKFNLEKGRWERIKSFKTEQEAVCFAKNLSENLITEDNEKIIATF